MGPFGRSFRRPLRASLAIWRPTSILSRRSSLNLFITVSCLRGCSFLPFRSLVLPWRFLFPNFWGFISLLFLRRPPWGSLWRSLKTPFSIWSPSALSILRSPVSLWSSLPPPFLSVSSARFRPSLLLSLFSLGSSPLFHRLDIWVSLGFPYAIVTQVNSNIPRDRSEILVAV